MERDYAFYRELFYSLPMPLAFVDLDLLRNNARDLINRAEGMPIRLASKSVRCIPLIKMVLAEFEQFQGIMAYSANEAAFLCENELDNILIGYPTSCPEALAKAMQWVRKGKSLIFMADCCEHLEALEKVSCQFQTKAQVALDVDLSIRLPGLHFGVHRSPLNQPKGTNKLSTYAQSCPHIEITAVMGYEAQIAGLPDRDPFASYLENRVVQLLKKLTIPHIHRRRQAVVQALRAEGCNITLVNGGGSGSIETTRQDWSVTEVTAGSGLFGPHLFDGFSNFCPQPAAAYAIPVSRRPQKNIVTCHGGGYPASGPAGANKAPRPYLPKGLSLCKNEGTGEVQTPLKHGAIDIQIGDPILFRHGKAGELCERFNSLYLIDNNGIHQQVPTYRGDGQFFV